MTSEEKRKIIREIIEQQFVPEVVVAVYCFLKEYRKIVAAATEYKIMTGFKGEVVFPIRLTLDLKQAEENLEENLVHALSEK
jgi:hypothetical protein